MQYLIFVLRNIAFIALDMSLPKLHCKFFSSIIILLLHVLAFFFLIFQIIFLYTSWSLFFNIAKEVVKKLSNSLA